MWANGEFEFKKEMRETNLFCVIDKYDQLMAQLLQEDELIMDRLTVALGVARYRIGGHSLRHSTASWLAEREIDKNDGVDNAGVAGVMESTGAWRKKV